MGHKSKKHELFNLFYEGLGPGAAAARAGCSPQTATKHYKTFKLENNIGRDAKRLNHKTPPRREISEATKRRYHKFWIDWRWFAKNSGLDPWSPSRQDAEMFLELFPEGSSTRQVARSALTYFLENEYHCRSPWKYYERTRKRKDAGTGQSRWPKVTGTEQPIETIIFDYAT